MMTTCCALLGGMPLALGWGAGSELRQPLGIAIVGGLIVSQMLTLFTTPVIYLYLDRLRKRFSRRAASYSNRPGILDSWRSSRRVAIDDDAIGTIAASWLASSVFRLHGGPEISAARRRQTAGRFQGIGRQRPVEDGDAQR